MVKCLICYCLILPRRRSSTLFPYTTLFRSVRVFKKNGGYPEPYVRIKNRQSGEYTHSQAATGVVQHGCACTRRSADRKSTRLNSSPVSISYAVFCWKKTTKKRSLPQPDPRP